MLSDSDIACLRESIFFGSLPYRAFEDIAAQARVIAVRPGAMICRQGDPAEAVFGVVSGAIKLTLGGHNGREVVVDIFEKGASFAEALLFRHDAYPFSAVALKASTVVAVPKSVLESELRARPESIPAVLSAAYLHLNSLLRQIEELKAASGLQRVAAFLLALADRNDGARNFKIPYEKQTIASMLGIKPETLSRSFRRLSEHGVRVSGPSVVVDDRAALQAVLEDA